MLPRALSTARNLDKNLLKAYIIVDSDARQAMEINDNQVFKEITGLTKAKHQF